MEKSVAKSVLMPGRNGGLLRRGSAKGNTPGPGRPKTAVRAAMRLALDERLGVLQEIADNPASSAGDRIRALEVLARYGLGTSDEVEARVEATRLTDAERRKRVAALLAKARGGG